MENREVWVIDDDAIFRMIVRSIAENAQVAWQVKEFPTVQGANEALMQATALPDVILLDINIPEGGGWMFLEEFEKRPFTKVKSHLFVCSSSIDANDKQRAFGSQCVRQFIEKPLPFDFFTAWDE